MPDDINSRIMSMLAESPLTRERVAQALHVEAHPTGAGKPHLNMEQGGMLFQWHPGVQKVYWLKPVYGKDGKQTHFSGQLIATDIETHGHAINAMLIWKRGYDEGSKPNSRIAMNEGTDT